MDKNFCKQIDQEVLVEEYVAGRLRGELLNQFEQHLKECEDHARALLLERALKRGVTDFARGEIKSKLRNRLKKREDTRFMLLRYAAVLLVAVITPLLLYYQFNVSPYEMAESLNEREESVISNNEIDLPEENQTIKEEPPKTELKARSSGVNKSENEIVQPNNQGVPAPSEPTISKRKAEQAKRLDIDKKQPMKSQDMQDMLKVVTAPSPPKLGVEHAQEEDINVPNDQAPAMATQSFTKEEPTFDLNLEMHNKIEEDSLAIRECIDKHLDMSERQKYVLELNIQVLSTGKIGEIKIINTTNQVSGLESCLYDIIKKFNFSDDAGGGLVVQKISY